MVRRMSTTIKDGEGNELKSEMQNVINEMEIDFLKELNNFKLLLQDIKKDTDYLTKEVMRVDSEYVSKTRFKPVEALVYGFAGLIFTGFVVALITLVIKQ